MGMRQLRLLLCAAVGLGLMIFTLFMTEWFRISMQGLGAMGVTEFVIDLRSASACLINGTCDSVPMSRFQGVYSTVSALTFYGNCGLALILTYEVIRHLLGGRASDGLAKLGYIAAVACFCATAAAGYLFQPEAATSNAQSAGIISVTVTRSWAPALLLAADVLAFIALHLAVAEERPRVVAMQGSMASASNRLQQSLGALSSPSPSPPPFARSETGQRTATGFDRSGSRTTARPGYSTREPATGAAADRPSPSTTAAPKPRASAVAIARAASPQLEAELRVAESQSLPAAGADDSSMAPAASNLAPSMEELVLVGEGDDNPAIEDAIAQLRIEPLVSSLSHIAAEPTPTAAVPQIREALPSTPPPVLTSPSTALRGKLNFATVEVTISGTGIDAKREDGTTKAVAWDDVVGVVARRLPTATPYDGETFVDVVSMAGSTLRIVPWTQLSGDDLYNDGGNAIERARAFVQLVASKCPSAQVDSATRSFLGGRGLAAQLPTTDLLAQHDERLS